MKVKFIISGQEYEYSLWYVLVLTFIALAWLVMGGTEVFLAIQLLLGKS